MSRAKTNAKLDPEIALQPGDTVLSKAELAARVGLSVRTIERSRCPVLLHEQREGATGARFRRRYIERVALPYFSRFAQDPRAPRRSAGGNP